MFHLNGSCSTTIVSEPDRELLSYQIVKTYFAQCWERGVGKEEEALARSIAKGSAAAAKTENGWTNGVKKAARDAADGYVDGYKEVQKDNIKNGHNPFAAPAPATAGNGQQFPQPLSGYQPRVDPDSGDFALPNDYDGVNFYEASGAPLGFSARNKSTGELDYFDRFGNRR